MTCYHPIPAIKTPNGVIFERTAHKHTDIIGTKGGRYERLKLPCGQCIGCRIRRASDWELRIMHEASKYKENCFVTLTYNDESLPVNNSLAHGHFQEFMKRLRWHNRTKEVRFYMCGEYGDQLERPHYHACIFNHTFPDRSPIGKSGSGEILYDSPNLKALWQKGLVSVQDLTHGTAAYCARYVLKKRLGKTASYDLVTEDGEIIERDPEYNQMSKGVAREWYNTYHADIHTHDYAIAKGRKRPVPRYYDKLLKERNAAQLETLKQTRKENAKQYAADNTPERLAVRETVTTAQMRTKQRVL